MKVTLKHLRLRGISKFVQDRAEAGEMKARHKKKAALCEYSSRLHCSRRASCAHPEGMIGLTKWVARPRQGNFVVITYPSRVSLSRIRVPVKISCDANPIGVIDIRVNLAVFPKMSEGWYV